MLDGSAPLMISPVGCRVGDTEISSCFALTLGKKILGEDSVPLDSR